MKRTEWVLIFFILYSVGVVGQVVRLPDGPANRQQDTTSVLSGRYAWNLSRIVYAMKWIENNRMGSTDMVYMSELDSAYRELKSYRDNRVNYALVDKQLNRLDLKLEKAWKDMNRRTSPYGLFRQELLSRKPDDTDKLILDGIAFREENKPEKAYQCFKKAVESDSTRLNNYYFLIMGEMEFNGDTARALDYTNKLISRSNGMKFNAYNPYLIRAWIAISRKQYSTSLEDVNRVLEKDTDNLEALSLHAHAKQELKEYAATLSDYQRMLKCLQFKPYSTDADSAILFNNIGWNYYLMKEYELCAEYACKCLEIKPDYGYALDTRGSGYYGLGEYERCIEDMTKAIGLEPELANSWYLRGMSNLKLNRQEKACADLSRAAALGVAEAAATMKGLCQPPDNTEIEKQRQFPNKKLPNVPNRLRIDPNGNIHFRL